MQFPPRRLRTADAPWQRLRAACTRKLLLLLLLGLRHHSLRGRLPPATRRQQLPVPGGVARDAARHGQNHQAAAAGARPDVPQPPVGPHVLRSQMLLQRQIARRRADVVVGARVAEDDEHIHAALSFVRSGGVRLPRLSCVPQLN